MLHYKERIAERKSQLHGAAGDARLLELQSGLQEAARGCAAGLGDGGDGHGMPWSMVVVLGDGEDHERWFSDGGCAEELLPGFTVGDWQGQTARVVLERHARR